MIYTSYFGNIKNIPENIIPISISLYTPSGINIEIENQLAPTKAILHKYKEDFNEDDYISDYKSYLRSINLKSIIKNLLKDRKDVALCCYESTNDFCHRHILAEEIEKIFGKEKDYIKEYGFEGYRKNGHFYNSKYERIAIIHSKNCFNYGLMQKVLYEYINDRDDIIIVSRGSNTQITKRFTEENNFKIDVYKEDDQIIKNSDIVFIFSNNLEEFNNIINLGKEQNIKVLTKGFNKSRNVSLMKRYSKKIVQENPDKIFVFGDNLEEYGKGGQAIIRDCQNSFGIPTKRKPSMSKDSFFSDQEDEFKIVENKLRDLFKLNKEIVFPVDGLGTGLAKMEEKSPLLFKRMNEIINKFFIGIK